MNYYKNLYSQPHKGDTSQVDAFVSQLNLTTVTGDQNESLMSSTTKEEIHSARN